MFLYELAVELDLRSVELVDAAADLGLGALTPASDLDQRQVATLRHHLSAPGSAPPPPPLAVAPPPPPPPPGATDGPPTFEPPVRFEPTPLVGSMAPPPPAPPSAPSAAAPTALTSASPDLPPPPPRPGSAPEPGSRSFSRKQLVALGVVGLLVVGLFAFMLVNGGRDEEREKAIAAGEVGREVQTHPVVSSTTAAGGGPAASTTSLPTTTEVDSASPVDVTEFCVAGASYSRIITRIAAALYDKDIAELKNLVSTRRAEWDQALDGLEESGPPMYADEVARYRDGMAAWFAAVPGAASVQDSYASMGELGLTKTFNTGDEFARQIPYYCK